MRKGLKTFSIGPCVFSRPLGFSEQASTEKKEQTDSNRPGFFFNVLFTASASWTPHLCCQAGGLIQSLPVLFCGVKSYGSLNASHK